MRHTEEKQTRGNNAASRSAADAKQKRELEEKGPNANEHRNERYAGWKDIQQTANCSISCRHILDNVGQRTQVMESLSKTSARAWLAMRLQISCEWYYDGSLLFLDHLYNRGKTTRHTPHRCCAATRRHLCSETCCETLFQSTPLADLSLSFAQRVAHCPVRHTEEKKSKQEETTRRVRVLQTPKKKELEEKKPKRERTQKRTIR